MGAAEEGEDPEEASEEPDVEAEGDDDASA